MAFNALAGKIAASALGSIAGKLGDNIGSFASGALSYAQQMNMMQKQYEYNLALQQQSQAWQTEMSNTAHQRQVKDLRSAGLNPILSANSGAVAGSAGTNSVAQPSGDPVGTAMAYKALRSQTKLNDTQELLNNANSAKANKEGFAAELTAKVNEKYLENKMKNENEITKSQISLNSANAKYLNERSRGFSESYSTSGDDTIQSGTFRLGPFQNTKPTQVNRYSWSRSRTY